LGNVVEFLDRFRSRVKETAPDQNPKSTKVSKDECLDLFLRAAQEVNKRYLPGTISYIGRHYPALDREIDESEMAVNSIWFAVERGEATIEELRDAIAVWYRLNLKAITIYSSHRFREKQSYADDSLKSGERHE
jgi:hypothetical protein